ncbi:hypothetical protein [Rummeliibacillus suwonensis]|uniref:hypothetical protein n=1 Tax=Rummeliibacillus suwonensis TaxID=1306154 RepID=UPI001AAEBDB5|nr:hypothetical protein [Rummeliibacillus suwonensis]MBO2537589.1 hypothetical protein [Rummeliibacillus suwonensis]
MRKKYGLGVLFSAVLITSLSFSLNAHASEKIDEDPSRELKPISLKQSEINNLKNLGFSEEEIKNMEQEEYDLNKNLKGNIVATEKNYVKTMEIPTISQTLGLNSSENVDETKYVSIELDKDTYYKELEELKKKEQGPVTLGYTPDESSTSYKTMTTTITKLSSTEFRVKNSIEWSKIPFWRYVDVSGVGINSADWYPKVNSQYGKQNWKTVDFWGKSRYYSATYTDASNKWDKKQGGYGLRMNLPNNDSEYTEDVWELSSYMYYTAYKENSTKHIDAYGHYAHQEKDLIAVPSFSLSGSSFSISSSSSFTIHKPNTHAVYSW